MQFICSQYLLNPILTRIDNGEEEISTLILNSPYEENIENAYKYIKSYNDDLFLSNYIAPIPNK